MKNYNILLLLFLSAFSFGQTLQNFSGSYEASEYNKGTATYTYYERDYERYYHGVFTYKQRDDLYNVTITGNFKDNLRNGKWVFKENQKDEFFLSTKYNGYSAIAEGNYIDGKRDGKWIYKRIENTTNKILIESTAFYKNGVLVGDLKFTCVTEWLSKKGINFICTFDENGNLYGDWKLKYKENGINREDIRKYENDKLTFQIVRNVSSGEILCKRENGERTYNEECSDDYLLICDIYNSWRTTNCNDKTALLAVFHILDYGNELKR